MTTVFVARKCPWVGCTNVSELEVDAVGYERWQRHHWLIQDAFPTLSVAQREFVKSGYCPEHMDLLFAPPTQEL